MDSPSPDVAYIYPPPFWGRADNDWVKSLLLFFDQVAILLPDYMYGRHYRANPELVEPLEERGLLRTLEPKTWIDGDAQRELAATMSLLLDVGAFDELDSTPPFEELSQSRAGYGYDVDVADEVVERLMDKGLALHTEDGVSLPMHPTVRATYLVLLGQLARGIGKRQNQAFHPTTANRRAVKDLEQFLMIDGNPTEGSIVETDLVHVGVDVSLLPLDEVVALRAEHRDSHREYMRNLRGFILEVSSTTDPEEHHDLMLERRENIEDEARRLQKRLRVSTRQVGSFGIGIAGGVWSARTGDPIGLGIAAASLLLGIGETDESVGAYTYLFDISR